MTMLVALLALSVTLAQETDLSGHWEGSLVHSEREYPLALDIARVDGAYRATIDLPDHLVYGCPVEVVEGSAGVVLRPALIEGDIRGTFDASTFVGAASVVAPESHVRLRRKGASAVRLNHEEIRFRSGDAELVGTLVKPLGEGPFPVIVWTHGSGPDTRSTFYYHGRAHLLARHGVAGFIYDKRGAGASTGSGAWKPSVLAGDAVAAVGTIKTRADVDGTRLGIAGFSQGGWVAPEVAVRSDDIDFVIVGATPGITGGEQNAFTALNALRRLGYDGNDATAAADLLMRLYRFYESGDGRAAVADALAAARSEAWFGESVFQGMLFLPGGELPTGRHPYWQPLSPDPADVWGRVTIPVLSMWGALDRQVPAERSRSVIDKALRAAGNDDTLLVIFPDASHGFWVVRPDNEPWDWPRQAPACASTLVEWVLDHTAQGNAR